jgi:hypothetical protein
MIIVKSISENYGGCGGINNNDFNDIIDIKNNPEFGGGLNITKIDIRNITIYSGAIVDGLQFAYNVETEGGAMQPYVGNRYGTDGSFIFNINLADDEHMVGISGTYGKFIDGVVYLLSIKFQTSKTKETYFYGSKNPADGFENIGFTLPLGVMFGSTIGKFVGSIGAVEIETVKKSSNILPITTTVTSSPSTTLATNTNLNDNVYLTNSPLIISLFCTTGILGLYFLATMGYFLWRKIKSRRLKYIPTPGTPGTLK